MEDTRAGTGTSGEIESTEIRVETQARTKPLTSLYSDTVSFIATPFDLRFVFGQVVPSQDGKLLNEEQVSIIMSWEHSKALLDFLKQNIDNHERDFGPLHYKKRGES